MTTKQHFVQTAAILKRAREHNAAQWDNPAMALADPQINKRYVAIAEFFANEYEGENPNFDRVRFFKACGFAGACDCPRIARRVECNDCGYPMSEALIPYNTTNRCGCSLHR